MGYDYDIIIVGGGIVGMATADALMGRHPHFRIAILEKENQLGAHQTGHNSGVIHSGIYYAPNSLKAKMCIEGREHLIAFAKEHHIPHNICGKLIVATNEHEIPHLQRIFANGVANGIADIAMIDKNGIREKEPLCDGMLGIWVPGAGIIDYAAVVQELAEYIQASPKHSVITDCRVLGFERKENFTEVHTSRGTYRTRHVIVCAGLHSDRLAYRDGVQTKNAIVGFRGDYYKLSNRLAGNIRHLVYPVPNPEFPFLGIHATLTIHGEVICGPNAVFVLQREGYTKHAFSWQDTKDAFRFPGTWRLFQKHWRFGLNELCGAFSKRVFAHRLSALIPSVMAKDLSPAPSGVRAMLVRPDGTMVDDFCIEYHDGIIHVLNAPSPAATASFSIGSAIAQMATERFSL